MVKTKKRPSFMNIPDEGMEQPEVRAWVQEHHPVSYEQFMAWEKEEEKKADEAERARKAREVEKPEEAAATKPASTSAMRTTEGK